MLPFVTAVALALYVASAPLLWCIAVPMSSLTEGGDHRAPVAGAFPSMSVAQKSVIPPHESSAQSVAGASAAEVSSSAPRPPPRTLSSS